MTRPLGDRFWTKVDKEGPVPERRPDLGPCWLWKARLDSEGYGTFKVRSHQRMAHRVAYELAIGPIPKGLTLDHLCRNRGCVCPSHTEPLSLAENVLRGEGCMAVNARKTHCPQGHAYTPENTMRTNRGRSRKCRSCHNKRGRDQRARARTRT